MLAAMCPISGCDDKRDDSHVLSEIYGLLRTEPSLVGGALAGSEDTHVGNAEYVPLRKQLMLNERAVL